MMTDIEVDPAELRAAAGRIGRSLARIERVRAHLAGAELTASDWGPTELFAPLRRAYAELHAEQLRTLRDAEAELQATIDRLRQTADRYEDTEWDSQITAEE